MDYFVFVGVGLFFTILFWAAMKLNRVREMEGWRKYDKKKDHEPKPARY